MASFFRHSNTLHPKHNEESATKGNEKYSEKQRIEENEVTPHRYTHSLGHRFLHGLIVKFPFRECDRSRGEQLL